MIRIFLIICWILPFCMTGNNPEKKITLHATIQVKTPDGSWKDSLEVLQWKPEETAIIICDMWDHHWCEGASKRVVLMAPKMNRIINSARKKGITIIHSPSETMDFYSNYPQRKKMETAPVAKSSGKIKDWYYLDRSREPDLPVDDSDGGCDTNTQPEKFRVWTREIQALEISGNDGISDSGKEINNFFIAHGIKNVILMGVHLNMCVLGRSFGIRGQVGLGRNVVVVSDLTDAMYNPAMSPHVDHEEGVELILKHIEKYWCPSIESEDLL